MNRNQNGRFIIRHVGEEREDHKYIARVFLKKDKGKNQYRYFYDKAAYESYLKNEKETELSGKKTGLIDKIKDSLGFDEREAVKSKKNEKDINELRRNITSTNLDYSFQLLKNHNNLVTEKTYNTYFEKYVNLVNEKNKIDKDLKKLVDDYSKTPIGKMENTIKKGKECVDDFLKTIQKGIGIPIDVYKDDRKRDTRFPELLLKNDEFTKKEDQALVNPKYSWFNLSYNLNCSYCTAAYDLRRRGYDVEASAIRETDDPTDASELMSWYVDAELQTLTDIKERQKPDGSKKITHDYLSELVEKDLEQHGDGARGFFLLYWTYGGGHAVVWEVENGDVILRDCQTNKTYKDVSDLVGLAKDLCYFRTDNLELADEIRRVVKNRE